MKALSVKQPYSGLIIAGIKNIENRSWAPKQAPGTIAICSTATPDAARWWQPMRDKCAALGLAFPEALCKINGAILGIVTVNHFIWLADGGAETNGDAYPVNWRHWWQSENIGWILSAPRRLAAPIPITGRLGLYNLPEEVEAQITKQLTHNNIK